MGTWLRLILHDARHADEVFTWMIYTHVLNSRVLG